MAQLPAACDLPEVSREYQDHLKDPTNKYEYLDHPADIQLHAWGSDLKEAFEQAAVAMFGYMTDLDTVEVQTTEEIIAEGDDLLSLLFHFLDEFLFTFSADPFFIPKRVEIIEFDKEAFKIRAIGHGETFDLSKHPQGTEVKAITYSNMQVYDTESKHEVTSEQFPTENELTLAMDLMEHVRQPVVKGVRLMLNSQVPLEGSMCISAFYLIYSTRKQESADEITVLHIAIDHLEHKTGSTVVVVHLKDFRRFRFEFCSPEECQAVVDALEILSKPERLQQLHAFFYSPRVPLPPCLWHFATCRELLARWQCSNERWRITTINREYQVCSSYPQEVIVPRCASNEDILAVALFRSYSRFPVLCFHHKKNQAVLVRCGQPLCGPSHKRCKEDAKMLNACLPSLSRGKILDVRAQTVAQSQMSKGGGIELPSHYPQWKIEYAKMEAPSSVQASLNKLVEACSDPSLASTSSWFGRLESTGWLVHIARLLQSAKFVTLCIHKDASSVVVHGAGSRDATLQVTALSQVLLDPHCRTVEGFIELVQREWLDGGHPFSLRHNHVTSAPEKEKGPMFLLFLDALWQVMQQYPLSFEFNQRFLHTLFAQSYYSIYGNFLYDTPKERHKQKLRETTQCLWAHLSQPSVLEPMLEPLYERNSSVLLITVHALNVTLWKRMYLRTDINPSLHLQGYETTKQLKDTNTALKQTLTDVRKELEALQTEGRKFVTNWS